MKHRETAVWLLREKAFDLAVKCADAVQARALFAPQDRIKGNDDMRLVGFDRLGRCLADRFRMFDAHIFIMAAGIVVRGIAPLLEDKATDPAVVVADETGKHVISLISGHLGGGNALAARLAACLGAEPVITTATDANTIRSVDEVARYIGAVVENKQMIKRVSTCMLHRVPVALVCDASLFEAFYGDADIRPDHFEDVDGLVPTGYDVLCFITEKTPELPGRLRENALFIRPPNLVVGIGCNKNTSREEISGAVKQVFEKHRLAVLSIAGVATVDLKMHEPGLVQYAGSIGCKLQCYHAGALDRVDAPGMSPPSAFSEKHAGAKGVAEPAALLGAGPGAQLVVAKQRMGNVTVAVALKQMRYAEGSRGKLCVVGIGPGASAFMTAHARRAIESSDVIVGYKKYIDLVAPLVAGRQVISTGMTKEIRRVDAAIRAADRGKTVALVCSGDAGVYGMAGLVYARMRDTGIDVATEVSPGVSAALSAASLLGAPLANDFITLSLSNLLTPTEKVVERIHMAAASGLVTAVYNPISRKRRELIRQLRDAFLQHREKSTIVGVVTNALRKGQAVEISTLDDFLACNMDMNTVVVVGNRDTALINGRMVTQRGYHRKLRHAKQ